VAISVYRLSNIKRKMLLFRGNDVGTTMMIPSFGAATTQSSVLEVLTKKMNPLLDGFRCHNPLILPYTAKTARKGRKWRF